jgi:D-alanyl-lipoteichoic acid acyltransferase DltB (MBOAT superfamily)
MVFNSVIFIVFLTIVLLLYYRLGLKGQNWMLLLASYVFYGWWDYRFLGLLLFTTFFDYGCALLIQGQSDPVRRRLLLAASMIVNLGVLCIFKYFNFFAASLQEALGVFGISLSFPMLHVVLPVGISFYTFLSMSYTIDVYRRELEASRDPIAFMLYVAYFPHLVAGPIVRASFLLPQCQKPRTIVAEEVANGIWLILMGYVKKVVIADRLAQVVNWGFSQGVPPLSDANSWLIIYAFAFQIYGDFSGYSDIARGLAKLMGFELVVNFRAPYLVTNAAAFWRHWHISLSTWLRDYLYIPLGGNRHGKVNTYRNLMTTMFLGGLWHGAGAAYILWGLYHGALLAIQRAWRDLVGSRGTDGANEHGSDREGNPVPAEARASRPSLAGLLKQAALVVVFFHIVCIGWLFFRAGALPAKVDQVKFVLGYLRTLAVPPRSIDPMIQGIALLGALSLLFQWKSDAMNRFSQWPVFWQVFSVTASLAAIASLGVFEGAQFIYFQF